MNIRDHLIQCQAAWGCLPHLVLACAGGKDEHWQIWSSDDMYRAARAGQECFPRLVSMDDGETFTPHPDAN